VTLSYSCGIKKKVSYLYYTVTIKHLTEGFLFS
jgi:hypothetical protein